MRVRPNPDRCYRQWLTGSALFLLAASLVVRWVVAREGERAKGGVPEVASYLSAEDGFIPLFNGVNLDGWIYGRQNGMEVKAGRGYRVENGVLYCTAEDGGNLFTLDEYSDFVLRLEFRLEPGSNNGIGIRTPLEGKASYEGMEIQVLDDSSPKYAKIRPAQHHGSIYDVVPAKTGSLKPVGEWNFKEITAHKRRITVKVNGITIVDANLDEIKDEATLKAHPGLARTKGHIGFLGHGTRVEFRNIRIRKL